MRCTIDNGKVIPIVLVIVDPGTIGMALFMWTQKDVMGQAPTYNKTY